MIELDWDLKECLKYNPQDGVTKDNITKILAVHDGKNDEEEWVWILELNNGKYAFLKGGCDYSGWD
jgi:hypothetical protein